MYGYGIAHLDEYKRFVNTSIAYAFQLDGISVKRRSGPRTMDLYPYRQLLNLRFNSVWTILTSALFNVHHLDPPPLQALGDYTAKLTRSRFISTSGYAGMVARVQKTRVPSRDQGTLAALYRPWVGVGVSSFCEHSKQFLRHCVSLHRVGELSSSASLPPLF